MKRTRASAIWTVGGILVLMLLGVSTSLVLAGQAGSPTNDDKWVADVDKGRGEGVLYAAPLSVTTPVTIYMPLISRNYFEAFTYQDNFDNASSGWPYGSASFDYGYKTDGDGSRVYHLRQTASKDNYVAFVTGPGTVAGNFDYTTWLRHASFAQPKMWGDQYGILISPTPIDPRNPVVNGAYTFYIKLKIGSGVNSSWGIAKWAAANKGAKTIIREQEETYWITDEVKHWNIFQIRRSGDQLAFYLTREGAGALQQVWTLTDSSLPYVLYIGFYGATAGDDFGDYEIEFQFDNLVANSAP